MPPPPRRQTRFHKVIVMQPMVAFKNALQEGRPLPRTPIALYRGLVVGVATRHY
jgi:solute carrier family 25 citrate transporter 1